MKAVIMAGGEGTRLRPQTSNLPKPMLPLVGRPMMEHIVSLLRRHGITDIVVTVAFLPNAIRSYFGNGSELGVRMVYATEETPLGTAGSVRNARDELTERFLVISGDVLTDINLSAMIEFHEKNGALATLALCAVENPLEFGIVITREDGSIERFLEKPGWGQVFSDTINTGIYVLEPEIFDVIPEGRAVDFSSEVFPSVLDAGAPLFGYVADGYWEDVGTTAAYLKAHEDILNGKVEVDISGFELKPGVFLGKGSSVDPSARLDAPAFIGENCTIDEDAVIGAYTTIGANTRVAERAELRHSVIGENSYIGQAARVEGSVLGRSCDLRRGARCEPGSVVGEGCLIGANAGVAWRREGLPLQGRRSGRARCSRPSCGSRVGPVRSSAARGSGASSTSTSAPNWRCGWPRRGRRRSRRARSSRPRGDTSRAARVLKRALMVGCNSVGVNVTDLEVATIPVTRHHIRTRGTQGGLTVRLSPDDPQSVAIRFFDSDGLDLSESEQRRIERLYHREEFRRVTAGDIGDIDFSPRALEHYTADVVEAFDLPNASRRDLKLVLDLSYGAASFVMPNLLSKVKADVLSINPYAQTPGMISVDPVSSAARVVQSVRASGADLGAVIDAGGEHLTLVDGTGRILTDDEALMVFLDLMTAGDEPVRVALPATVSFRAYRLGAARGTEIITTALSSSRLMEAAASGGVAYAADQDGGFIFPDFLPSFDGAAALVKLIALLGRSGESLAQVASRLPDLPVIRTEVETPFEQKGLVMRTLMEQLAEEDSELILIDGIKVLSPTGWVLVVPDPEEPTTHVWAEGADRADSERLSTGYVERLRQILSIGD